MRKKKKKNRAEALKTKKVKCGLCHEEIDLHLVNLVPMHKRCVDSLRNETASDSKLEKR